MQLKKVQYESPNLSSVGEVAYLILEDGTCVFTYSRLVSRRIPLLKRATSTINSMEQIVEAICTKEKRNPEDLVFYDLQASRGYCDIVPGQFVFDKISFVDGEPFWDQVLCSPEIVNAFRTFIGGLDAQQVTDAGEPFQA